LDILGPHAVLLNGVANDLFACSSCDVPLKKIARKFPFVSKIFLK